MAQTIFYKPLATLFSLLCVLISLHPGASLSWIGTNILKDLESFGTDFNSEASLWTLSSCFSGSGCTKYSYCSGLPILGGYQILGGSINEYYQRVYTGLPPHNQIKVNVTFYPIDSWDSPDYFELQFDTQSYTAWRPYSNVAYTQSYCGSAIYPDYPPINAEIYVPHTGSTLTFRVKSKLDESTIDESLGFRDITIEFLNTNSPSSSICGRVPSGILDDKVCPCSAGTYMNPPSSGNCYPCNSLCATCTGPNSTQCTSCPAGAILYGGTCIMNTTNNNTGCADPSLYKYQNDSCLPTCPYPFISEWQNGTNFCNAPCSSGSFLYQNGSCLPYCGSGYVSRIEGDITYCDKIPQAQYPCHIGLNYDNRMTTNCSNLDNACAPNHFQYQNGSCILYCIDPFYGILRNASAYCYPPSSFPDVNNTVPGDNGNSTNNITCPSGTYLSGGFCLSCNPSCTTCNGPQSCLSCQTGLALFNSSCIPCPSGTYLSGGFCLSCHASCTTCNGPQSCLSCQAGLILINSSCITCPAGQYANPWDSCSYCSSGCEICTDSFNCQICSSGYILTNGTCNNDISIPPNNTDTGNSTNSTNSTYNNGCSGANFYKHQNGSCVASCPSPFVFSWFNNSAYCNSPCAKGTYLSVNNTCITGCEPDETPRIQDYLMFCDKTNTTNSTNSTNSPSVILQIYIRYNISLVDFSSQEGLTKFVQQVAALLGIDPSYIMIVSIREGSTIIESQISIASASDEESMNAAMALAEAMGNKVSNAVSNNNLNIISGVSILDHRNSIQVVKTATSSNQIQVSGDSSSSGAIIGLGAGLAVLAVIVISYAVYRYKKNLKLKSMRNKENTTKDEPYKIEANVNQTNQEGKDESMVRIKNGQDTEIVKSMSIVYAPAEIDMPIEERKANMDKEISIQNIESNRVKVARKISRNEISKVEADMCQEEKEESLVDTMKYPEIDIVPQMTGQVLNSLEDIRIQVEGQEPKLEEEEVSKHENQDEQNLDVHLSIQEGGSNNQNVNNPEQQDDNDEKPMSLDAVLASSI